MERQLSQFAAHFQSKAAAIAASTMQHSINTVLGSKCPQMQATALTRVELHVSIACQYNDQKRSTVCEVFTVLFSSCPVLSVVVSSSVCCYLLLATA
jgi:hypothetical protein